jgi:predicted transcriptional regulator
MKRVDLKREANRTISDLPRDTDWEDLMYLIYVRKKIDAGLRDSAAGRVYTSAQIRKALKLAS